MPSRSRSFETSTCPKEQLRFIDISSKTFLEKLSAKPAFMNGESRLETDGRTTMVLFAADEHITHETKSLDDLRCDRLFRTAPYAKCSCTRVAARSCGPQCELAGEDCERVPIALVFVHSRGQDNLPSPTQRCGSGRKYGGPISAHCRLACRIVSGGRSPLL